MPRRPRRAWADTGAGGQRVVHPAQADFINFYPAVAQGRLAALFKGLAAALRIKPGELAKGRFARKQRPEKMHGDRPPEIEAKHALRG